MTTLDATRRGKDRDRTALELMSGSPPSALKARHHVSVALPREDGGAASVLVLWLEIVERESGSQGASASLCRVGTVLSLLR